jgi:hypothetical protein
MITTLGNPGAHALLARAAGKGRSGDGGACRIVGDRTRRWSVCPGFPAALARLDLAGKEIGAFRFAPAGGDMGADQAIDFAVFLIAQANAFDAYKRHIVKTQDEAAYRAEAKEAAANPALANANVALIFDSQLKA